MTVHQIHLDVHGEDAHVIVDVPAGWEPITGELAGGAVAGIVRTERHHGFAANVLIFADVLPPGEDLASWVAAHLDDDRPLGVDLDGRVGSESIGTIEGRPAMFRLVHLTARHDDTEVELDQTHVATVVDLAVPDATLVVEFVGTSTSESLEANAPAFTAIAHSLRSVAR